MDMENMASSDSNLVYTGEDPWYLRTLPGRTGDFMGHFIPGVCYAGLGTGLLLWALYNSRRLPPGKSFAEMHIPESDPWFLRWFGILNMAGSTVGAIYEIIDKDPGFDHVAFTHCTLYFSYFLMGICALYESKGRLPLDTHRAALAIACVAQSLVWHAHGSMKKMPADGALHILLGYLNLANGATVAYSIRCQDSVIAFLGGWALLVVQGFWIILSGLYECCIDLKMHDVATYLSLLCLIVFLVVVLGVAHFGPPLSDQDLAKYRGNFSVVSSNTADEEEENTKCFPVV